MEKATFHAQLTALREKFPEGELICLKDAAQYVGIDYRTLQGDRTFPMKKMGRKYMVSVINLARWLAV